MYICIVVRIGFILQSGYLDIQLLAEYKSRLIMGQIHLKDSEE